MVELTKVLRRAAAARSLARDDMHGHVRQPQGVECRADLVGLLEQGLGVGVGFGVGAGVGAGVGLGLGGGGGGG